MKKIILYLILSIVMLFTLTSCKQNENYNEHMPEYGPQFMLLEEYEDPYLGKTYILVDKDSRVIYLLIYYDTTNVDSKSITPLYDNEGKVKRYTGAIID